MNYNQQKSKGDCSYTIPLDVGVKVVRGRSIDEDYDVGDEIGIGSDGVVKICQDRKTGEEFCCKLMEKWNYPQRIRAEVDMMCRLSAHPGIVKLHAVYEDSKSGNLVMELCSGGTLTDVMHEKRRPFSEDEARKIMKELMESVGYCHRMGIMHRDIKMDNILLSPSSIQVVKLGDFGLATFFEKDKLINTSVGTMLNWAPEMHMNAGYSVGADIWGAGVVLYELLCGKKPFSCDGYISLLRKNVLNSEPDMETGVWALISEPCKDLISGMLKKDAKERLTTDQVLSHSWLNHGSDSDSNKV